MSNQNHPYHLVEKSPWPLTASVAAMFLTMGLVKWFHTKSMSLLNTGLIMIILTSFQWWRDICRESSLQGLHSIKVTNGLRWGMILFIMSEVMFFFSFFWAFFHSSLNPTMEIGNMWPPFDITPFNPMQIPLLNTAILLASGITITWSHHEIIEKNHSKMNQSLLLTITLGLYFTLLQAFEYTEAPFTVADSIYGSTFFVATGFHGLHVIIGTLFLMVCLNRSLLGHFSSNHHMGYEAAIWYWHFVDVVWLFLYMTIYFWAYN